jgi:hypothetical protein
VRLDRLLENLAALFRGELEHPLRGRPLELPERFFDVGDAAHVDGDAAHGVKVTESSVQTWTVTVIAS